jgi:hypothetical protein
MLPPARAALGIELPAGSSHLLAWGGTWCAIWDILEGRQILNWDAGGDAAFTAQQSRVVAIGGLAELWDITDGTPRCLAEIPCPGYPEVSFSLGLAPSPQENVVYCGAGRKIFALDFDLLTCTPFEELHLLLVYQLVHHPTAATLFSTGLSNLHAFESSGSTSQEIIYEWDTQSRKVRRTFVGGLGGGNPRLAIAPDGKWLAIVEPHVPLRCISLVDDSVITSDTVLPENALGLAFHPSGEKFVVVTHDIWIYTCPELKLVSHVKALPETETPAWGCGFMDDGSVLYGNRSDGVLRRIDPMSGRELLAVKL